MCLLKIEFMTTWDQPPSTRLMNAQGEHGTYPWVFFVVVVFPRYLPFLAKKLCYQCA